MASEAANNHDEVASSENLRFRAGYSKIVSILVALVLLMVVLIPLFFVVTFMPNPPRYYSTTTTGVVQPMQPLSEPVITDTYLRSWVSNIAGGIFTVNFNDWQTQLNQYNIDFTSTAWQQLTDAYKNNGFADTLVKNQLVASAVVSQTPQILNEMVVNGRYTWNIVVPVLIKYTSASATMQQKVTLSLVISRVPDLKVPQGIQISYLHTKLDSQSQAAGIPNG